MYLYTYIHIYIYIYKCISSILGFYEKCKNAIYDL